MKRIGVFALQGDFAAHVAAWGRAGAAAHEVRTAADLEGIDALSLPGGESTTMLRLLEVTGLRPAFGEAIARLPVFATCAGAILLGHGGAHLPAPPFARLDLAVERNAYGRQVDSFEADLDAPVLGPGATFRGVFIRAPRFTRLGTGLETLVSHAGEPVGVRDGSAVALAFHPELTDDLRLHHWFLDTVVASSSRAAVPLMARRA
ncbi:MAG: pyridoxal 5'-phosphate synthase glutaminase subunit PdxT [Candidatus Eisenbacteria bacterium]